MSIFQNSQKIKPKFVNKSEPKRFLQFVDGLIKEFCEMFWTELKEIYVDYVLEAKEKWISSTSQGEAIIKLIEKRYR